MFLALFAHFVQRGADAIIIQHLFSFGSTMFESKFALDVRGVAKISRERQSLRHDKAVFFAVFDHLASDAQQRVGPLLTRLRREALPRFTAATIRVKLRVCARQHPMGGIIGRSTIKLNRRA